MNGKWIKEEGEKLVLFQIFLLKEDFNSYTVRIGEGF